ncbi:hypothetical protein M8494_15800 [Serratia ureilytica]
MLNNNNPATRLLSLNISCQNMQQEGIADRAVEMFLSSNNLLVPDASVLTTPTLAARAGGAAPGQTRYAEPLVVVSPSNVDRGSAKHQFMPPRRRQPEQSLHHRHGRLLLSLSARWRDAG